MTLDLLARGCPRDTTRLLDQAYETEVNRLSGLPVKQAYRLSDDSDDGTRRSRFPTGQDPASPKGQRQTPADQGNPGAGRTHPACRTGTSVQRLDDRLTGLPHIQTYRLSGDQAVRRPRRRRRGRRYRATRRRPGAGRGARPRPPRRGAGRGTGTTADEPGAVRPATGPRPLRSPARSVTTYLDQTRPQVRLAGSGPTVPSRTLRATPGPPLRSPRR